MPLYIRHVQVDLHVEGVYCSASFLGDKVYPCKLFTVFFFLCKVLTLVCFLYFLCIFFQGVKIFSLHVFLNVLDCFVSSVYFKMISLFLFVFFLFDVMYNLLKLLFMYVCFLCYCQFMRLPNNCCIYTSYD